MVGCGGRMLFNIRQSRKRVTQQRALNIIPVMTIGTITSNTNSTGENNQKSTVENMLFLMVLANVCTYIITQIPFNTYTVYYGYGTSRDYLTYSLIRAFLLMWSSIYFGVGFYLFSIASPQFRKQFLKKMKFICVCFRGLQQQGLAKRNNQH
jgi:Na+/H+ antiporter NhaC